MMMPIAVINYNGSSDTIELIDSILNTDEEFDLIITDNDSPKRDELKLIENHIINEYNTDKADSSYSTSSISYCAYYKINDHQIITLIQAKSNGGFSIGTNIGIKYAIYKYPDTRYLTILNNDTIVTKNFLSTIVDRMEKYDLSAAMGTILFYGYDKPYIWSIGGPIDFIKAQGVHRHKGEVFHECSEELVYRKFVSGCFTVFNTNAIKEVGLLDEDYFFSGEEYQYSYDISKKYKLAWIPSSIIYHKSKLNEGNGSSHNINDLAWQYNAYMTKIVFINKNKNCVYAKLWHIVFLFHLSTIIRKRYLAIPEYGNRGYQIMKEYLIKNIKRKKFLQKDFADFRRIIEQNS